MSAAAPGPRSPGAGSARRASRPSFTGKAPPPPKSRAQDALSRFHEEGAIEQSYDARMLAKIWPFVRPHAGYFALSLGLLLVIAGLAIARPLVMRGALNDPHVSLTRYGLTIAVMLVLEQSIAFPQMYLMQVGGARAMAELRLHVFRFLHTRKLGFFDRTPVGRLVTRVTNDVDAINEMFGSGALNALGDLVRLVAIVVILVGMDAQMALIAFVALPPVMIGVTWTRRRIRDAFREVRAKTARMNAYLNEQVSGMAVVQAYAREEQSDAEFDEINHAYRDANNRSIVYDATLDAAIEMISSICIASVLWYAGVRTARGVKFGDLFAFIVYIEMFFGPIRDLSARYTLLQSAMAGAERIFQLLENKDEDAAKDMPQVDAGDAEMAFELDDVTFGYKAGAPVIRDVSFHARNGERIALVGATGAGKSTIAALLLRLYEVDSGSVRVFGKDVRSFARDALRTSFAVVPQDVFLFPGTVATNIAAGDVEPDRAKVEQALKRIGALDLFERRPEGLDAKVLERGANFSAGERQLIAFARALYRDPPILVLDEATANVDSDTEARLQRALESAMAGRTALIIAHRLSTIRAVDRIIVFHKGRIVEQGTHEALLAAGGLYAKLHSLQFAKEAVEKKPAVVTGAVTAGAE